MVWSEAPTTGESRRQQLFPVAYRHRASSRLYRRTRDELGRALPLYPGTSDLNLLGNFKSVVNFDAQIPHRALDLRMSKQQLNRTEVAGALVDQGRFRPADRMRAVDGWIEPTAVSHWPNNRAYCRVVRCVSSPPLPGNRYWPGARWLLLR